MAEDDPKTRSALADTARITGAPCHACGATLCGHDAVSSLVLGYKNAPRCLPCIAAHMAEPLPDLRVRTFAYVRRHDCFHTAWVRASALEGVAADGSPACLTSRTAATPETTAIAPTTSDASARWDAGGMGCGDLVLELRLRLRQLAPGAVLELRATDPGAPLDLPAWCKLTGHALLAAEHPEYRIRRK